MKYLAAIPLVLLFAIMDVFCVATIIPMFLIADDGNFPLCYTFAKRVWKD